MRADGDGSVGRDRRHGRRRRRDPPGRADLLARPRRDGLRTRSASATRVRALQARCRDCGRSNFTSPYECAAWAVISQRISMRQAAAIQDRLIAAHGTRLGDRRRGRPGLPRPGATARAWTRAAASRPRRSSASTPSRKPRSTASSTSDRLRALGDVDGPESVRSIRGIGPFWASGIYLRACGIVDVFPDEPIAIAALGALHGLGDRPSPADIDAADRRLPAVPDVGLLPAARRREPRPDPGHRRPRDADPGGRPQRARLDAARGG